MSSQFSIIDQIDSLENHAGALGKEKRADHNMGSNAIRQGDKGNREEDGEEEEENDEEDDSSYTYESDVVDYNLGKEWQDIVTQFNSLVFLVCIPVIGRMVGRRFAHYIWRRIADHLF